MIFSRLLTAAVILPTLILAGTHDHPGRVHRHAASRRTPATNHQSPPRALPAEANAGHKSVRKALKRRAAEKRQQCQARTSTSAPAYTPSATQDYTTATTTSWYSPSSAAAQNLAANAVAQPSSASPSHTRHHSSTPTSTSSPAAASSSSSGGLLGSVGGVVSGLLSITDPTCGWCDSSNSNPNGSEDWINCGITGAGWTPPMVQMSELVYADLTSDGPFSSCSQYFYLFEQYGGQYSLPPILLASFALQESSCNPGATGGNGEAGLMQLGSANCANAPNGNCYDLDYNVQTAAQYFSNLLSQNGGNVYESIGNYNGWTPGMTTGSVYAVAGTDCTAQQNLDYVFQMVNGWMQNTEGNTMGQYFNLAQCS